VAQPHNHLPRLQQAPDQQRQVLDRPALIPPVPDRWLALASALADAATAQTWRRFRTGLAVDDKRPAAGFDPVTEADREAEAAMRRLLAERAPDHGVVGEEHGSVVGTAPWTWVLDPIDGTRAFIAGFPTWTTLIGLLHEGEPVAGIIEAPATGERWTGVVGVGTTWTRAGRSEPARVRRCARLADAVLSTTNAELFRTAPERDAWDTLCDRTRLRRYGGDGYAYGLVASGTLDLVVELGLAPYDVVGPIAVVRAAGGIATAWDGGPAADGGTLIAAGDPRVHAEALALLRAAGAVG
jgi:myo-inositol-1(or 4)-monophosphatase